MPLSRCRHCDLALTDAEFRSGHCPACGGPLAVAPPTATSPGVARRLGAGLLLALGSWLVWLWLTYPDPVPDTAHPVERLTESPRLQMPEPLAVLPVASEKLPEQAPPEPLTVAPLLVVPPAPDPPPSAVAAAGKLRVQYICGDNTVNPNQLRFKVRIVNDGDEAVPLPELALRYWYTRDGTQAQHFDCDYAVLGNRTAQPTFHVLPKPIPGADIYLELAFGAAAPKLPPRQNTGEIQGRVHRTDWTHYTQTNDYSFAPQARDWTDAPSITLYRKGVLIWGVEPARPRTR